MKPGRIITMFIVVMIIAGIATNNIHFLFPFSGCTNTSNDKETGNKSVTGRISISGAFALYPLTVRWAEKFREQYPGVQIDISAGGAGKGMADVLSGMVDLAMFSREVTPVETAAGAWKIAVAKDAVFPTMNISNPDYRTIIKKGLTRNQFREVYMEQTRRWGQVFDNGSKTEIHVYTRSDACGAGAVWANYLGLEQENLKGTGVYGDPGMADAVKNDPLGIGYNNLIYLYDLKTKRSHAGLSVIPFDLNENRIIDPEEDLYGTMDQVMDAVRNGQYPSPPARNLYLISKGKPSSAAMSAFLNYILNEGQTQINISGFIPLDSAVLAAQKDRLSK